MSAVWVASRENVSGVQKMQKKLGKVDFVPFPAFSSIFCIPETFSA